jgi:hypothetical protein
VSEKAIAATYWRVLYGEEYEQIPDPNKPENTVWHRAKKQERATKFKNFVKGPGSVLFDEWQKKVKQDIAALLAIPPQSLCNCPACMIVRDTRKYLELLVEAEQVLTEN